MNNETTVANIAKKAEQATASYGAVKDGLAASLLSNENADAKVWARAALQVAEAEGIAVAWVRLNQMAVWAEKQNETITRTHVLGIITDLLTQGADDTWSGRGNDVARARFDGIRTACSSMDLLIG